MKKANKTWEEDTYLKALEAGRDRLLDLIHMGSIALRKKVRKN
jgi:hypothetical protein